MNPSNYREFCLATDRRYEEDVCTIIEPSQMSNDELDNIIRLIPYANERQTLIIEGQIVIHKKLKKFDDIK